MTHDRKTLEMIDQIADQAGERLSEYATQRLADLRHILAAGGTITTCERAEVHELWARYAPTPRTAEVEQRMEQLSK